MSNELATAEPAPCVVAASAYHADVKHVSHSMLEVARRSILEYAARFVHQTLPAAEPTKEMRIGTLLHTAVLEPARWASRRVWPKCDRRTKAGKAAHEDFERSIADDADAVILTTDEAVEVSALAMAVLDHPIAAQCLSGLGDVERPIRWADAETGLLCKAKPDKALASGMLVDLKSAADPSPDEFYWAAKRYGYFRQAAHYLAGAWQSLQADGPFVFVVVGKRPPHEVVIYTPGANELAEAAAENRTDLAEIAECYRTDQWGSRWLGIQTLSRPQR